MNCHAYKKGMFSVFVLITALFLLVGCGQQKAVKNDQQDNLESNSINYIETEADPDTTPEAAEQDINVTPAPTAPEQSPKAAQQQTAPAQNSNTSASAKVNNTLETASVNNKTNEPNQVPEQKDISQNSGKVIHSEGASIPNSEPVKVSMKNSLQSLVNAGTITQEQAEKIIDAFPDEAIVGSGIRISYNPVSTLVEQGVITQEQADAVMNALMSIRGQTTRR